MRTSCASQGCAGSIHWRNARRYRRFCDPFAPAALVCERFSSDFLCHSIHGHPESRIPPYLWRALADGVVAGVGDEEGARAVDGHALRGNKLGGAARAVRAADASGACRSRNGGHDTRWRDLADGVVAGIGDLDDPRAVDAHLVG